jgi:hypothetical protein
MDILSWTHWKVNSLLLLAIHATLGLIIILFSSALWVCVRRRLALNNMFLVAVIATIGAVYGDLFFIILLSTKIWD